ncbi:uncharacterized protein LOC143857565 [Tasmannia lanceolata]|uniref:uncharacterized protein LOC143857565 n=1 Tax=Tasmannia lanceolata TaxID=3420 RepID=UPI004063B0AB
MGVCHSSDVASVPTAKVILQDGKLEEFSYPVKVSYILEKNPSCFICNSDELEFESFVTAINDSDELQLGQLYFVLPLSRLKYPVQAEEIASLAVKANRALRESGIEFFGGCRRNRVVFPAMGGRREAGVRRDVGHSGISDGLEEERRDRVRNRNGRNCKAKLSAIQE